MIYKNLITSNVSFEFNYIDGHTFPPLLPINAQKKHSPFLWGKDDKMEYMFKTHLEYENFSLFLLSLSKKRPKNPHSL